VFIGDAMLTDQAGLEGSSDRVRNARLSQVCQDHQTRQRRRLVLQFIILGVFLSYRYTYTG